VIKRTPFKITLFVFMMTAVNAFAQEDTVEVGKHANPNLDAMSMVLSLLMVLALIVVSAWILKKFNLANKSVSGMQVISSLPLGHKEKLVVVQIAEEQLLLGVSGQQINLIKTLDKPLEINSPISSELGQKLNRFIAKKTVNKTTEQTSPSKNTAEQQAENNSSSSV
jgi:flagellar protein FliO/FliZ